MAFDNETLDELNDLLKAREGLLRYNSVNPPTGVFADEKRKNLNELMERIHYAIEEIIEELVDDNKVRPGRTDEDAQSETSLDRAQREQRELEAQWERNNQRRESNDDNSSTHTTNSFEPPNTDVPSDSESGSDSEDEV